MIISAAFLPVMVVVRAKVRIDAVLLQNFGDGIVKRLQRPPAAVQKGRAGCVHVPSRGHARHGTDVGILEGDTALGEALKVRGNRALATVGWEKVTIERVEHQNNGFHGQEMDECEMLQR